MKTVREGKKVWPHCTECGCRLYAQRNHPNYKGSIFFSHYGDFYYETDARGHTCSLIRKGWYADPSRIYPGVEISEYGV